MRRQCAEKIEHLVPQRFTKFRLGQRGQHPERAGRQEYAIGDQRMDVWVEGDKVAEGLHVKNERGLTPRFHGFEAGPQQAGNQPANLTEMAAVVAKERPYQLRQGEHVLAMR